MCAAQVSAVAQRLPQARAIKTPVTRQRARCHRDGEAAARRISPDKPEHIVSSYNMSIHGKGLLDSGLTVTATCTDCHTAHNVRNHNDPASTIHRDNVAGMCKQCHGLIENVHQKVIQGESWEESPDMVPVCIECHQPHEVRRVYYDEGMSDRECMACHRDPNLVGTLPGAAPALMGAAAATGRLDAGHVGVFLVLVVWQLPHALAMVRGGGHPDS